MGSPRLRTVNFNGWFDSILILLSLHNDEQSLHKNNVIHVKVEDKTRIFDQAFLGMVFTSDGNWSKEIGTRIIKANAILREACRIVLTKAFKHCKTVSYRTLLRSSPLVMDFEQDLKQNYLI